MQFMCLLLYYVGKLAQYSKGNAPCEVILVSHGLQAKFNYWYTNQKDNTNVSFEMECFFVKQVSKLLLKMFEKGFIRYVTFFGFVLQYITMWKFILLEIMFSGIINRQ